jgi:hypothetical protein
VLTANTNRNNGGTVLWSASYVYDGTNNTADMRTKMTENSGALIMSPVTQDQLVAVTWEEPF